MRPVLKTNNPVLLSFAQSLLGEAEIDFVVFDENASVMDGSLGILPRRLMVADDDFERGQAVLREGIARRGEPPNSTEDHFLDGRLTVRQYATGFRAGLDAVMLAAAVPAHAGDSILELGSGCGTASLCLAACIADISITGAEIESDLVRLSNANATANRLSDRVVFVTVDVLDLPADMKRDYDHVICNPPFHGMDGERSPDELRAGATRDDGFLVEWLRVGTKRTASGGTFTCIVRADRFGETLAALPKTGLRIFPLWPRHGDAAKRVIVQLRKGSGAAPELLAGLVLHRDDGSYTDEADAVLRGQARLPLA
jgi:tRNA1Val (adenine37-N6)-methyltransferase